MQMVISCSTTHYYSAFSDCLVGPYAKTFLGQSTFAKVGSRLPFILSVLMSNFPKPECIPRLRFRPFFQLATQKNIKREKT